MDWHISSTTSYFKGIFFKTVLLNFLLRFKAIFNKFRVHQIILTKKVRLFMSSSCGIAHVRPSAGAYCAMLDTFLN